MGGITESPLDTYYCAQRRTDLAICDNDRMNIIIDLDYCTSLNIDGSPVDVQCKLMIHARKVRHIWSKIKLKMK